MGYAALNIIHLQFSKLYTHVCGIAVLMAALLMTCNVHRMQVNLFPPHHAVKGTQNKRKIFPSCLLLVTN